MKGFGWAFLFSLLVYPAMTHADIVQTDEVYTYDSLTEDMLELAQAYPEIISYKSLTSTRYGRNVWAIKIGHGKTNILLNGAHHAREWMTSTLLMRMVETYAHAYKVNQRIADLDPNLINDVSIWFVPMVNPDGVTLQQAGLLAFPSKIHWDLIAMNEGSLDFIRWKANLAGIDLNRQYPANWKYLKGVSSKPSYQFYKGTRPLEAEEVIALIAFTNEIKPEIAVSYHSSGNVLFWGFHQWGLTHTTNFADDYFTIAQEIAKTTKYKLEEPASYQQGGGYTDWFIETYEKPALTIEIGSLIEESSLSLDAFPDIWDRNKGIGLFVAKKALERKKQDLPSVLPLSDS